MNETPVDGSASGTSDSSSGNQHKRKAVAISIAQRGDDTVDSGNDNDPEVASQTSVINEVSTQNFLAPMEKRFAFYKCDNLTINFRSDN